MRRTLFLLVGTFALLLGGLLLVAPGAYLDLYMMNPDVSRTFAAQRLAPVVAGLGGLMLVLRALPDGPVIRQVCLLTALVWFGVGATGIYHYATGVAGVAILWAAAIEAVAGGFFLVAAQRRG